MYGCSQYLLTPQIDKEGKKRESPAPNTRLCAFGN